MENIEINQKINKFDVIHHKGVVYKYTELETGIYYIGSTTNKKSRHSKHKSDFYNENQPMFNCTFYCELRKINKNINNCSYEILKKYYDITRKELLKHEEEYIKLYKNDKLNFNKNKSYRTNEELKEYIKEYIEENKEKLKEYQKEYREEKKEEIKEYKNKKNICEVCGGKYTTANKAAHIKLKKHQQVLLNNEIIFCHICKDNILYKNQFIHYNSESHKRKALKVMRNISN